MSGRNFDAAVYVLRDPLIAAYTKPCISLSPEGIRFDMLLEQAWRWTPAERLLLLAALDLWNGSAARLDRPSGWRTLAGVLGLDQLQRVFDGVRILAGHPVCA